MCASVLSSSALKWEKKQAQVQRDLDSRKLQVKKEEPPREDNLFGPPIKVMFPLWYWTRVDNDRSNDIKQMHCFIGYCYDRFVPCLSES